MTTEAPVQQPGGTRLGRVAGHPQAALASILIGQLMVILDLTIVNIALPDIQGALHFSPENLSWVVNAYALAFGGLLLLGARAGDLLGQRRMFLTGIAVFTLASLLGGLAPNAGVLLAARGIQGLGGALASPTALALLMTQFREGRERTKALGMYLVVSIGGSAVGLMAGGMLVAWASWRWIFIVNIPIGIGLLLLSRLALPDSVRTRGRFDLAGALTSTAGMTALVFGFVRAATDGWRDVGTIGAFLAGVVLLATFVLVETHAEAPITPLRLFASRDRACSYLVRLLLIAGMQGLFFFLTQFMQDVLGYSALVTGFAFLPVTIAVFLGSRFVASKYGERINPRTLMLTGISLSVIGVLLLANLSENSSYASLLASLITFALGNGLAFVPLTNVSLSGVEPRDAGSASGLVNVMQQVGGSLGLSILVTVFGAASHHAARHPGGRTGASLSHYVFTKGADVAFLTAAGFLLISLMFAFAIRRSSVAPATTPEGAAAAV
jgi:EmrB/QacA subfamily drug resistance transporter